MTTAVGRLGILSATARPGSQVRSTPRHEDGLWASPKGRRACSEAERARCSVSERRTRSDPEQAFVLTATDLRVTGSGPREWRTVPFPRAHRGSLLFTQGTAGAFTSERRLCSPSEQALGATARLTLGGDQQGKKRLHLPLTCTSPDGQGDSDLFANGTALPVPPRKGQRVPKRNTLGVPRRNALGVPKRNGTAAESQRPGTSGTMVTSNRPSNLGVSGKVVHVDMLLKPLASHSAVFPSAPGELVRRRSRSGSSLPPLTAGSSSLP